MNVRLAFEPAATRSPNWRTPVPEAVIVSALRTPIGTARKGTLRDTTAFDLAHHVVAEAAATSTPRRSTT